MEDPTVRDVLAALRGMEHRLRDDMQAMEKRLSADHALHDHRITEFERRFARAGSQTEAHS